MVDIDIFGDLWDCLTQRICLVARTYSTQLNKVKEGLFGYYLKAVCILTPRAECSNRLFP